MEIADLFLFHSVCQIILTHAINIPLIGFMVRKFKLSNECSYDNEMLGDFLQLMDEKTRMISQDMITNFHPLNKKGVSWEQLIEKSDTLLVKQKQQRTTATFNE